MKIIFSLLGIVLLSACVSRTVERETVVDPRPSRVEVVPAPQGATAPAGDTTIIVPR
jgi:hypothetical protein